MLLSKLTDYLIYALLLIFVSANSFGQVKDSLIVLNELQGFAHIECKPSRGKINKGVYSKEDSLNDCLLTKTFKTDYKDVCYIKKYDLHNQLRDEGFGKIVWVHRKILGIKLKSRSSIVYEGKWKFYDSNGNKISDCCYANGQLCMNCLWIEFDEKGNKTGEYKMELKR